MAWYEILIALIAISAIGGTYIFLCWLSEQEHKRRVKKDNILFESLKALIENTRKDK